MPRGDARSRRECSLRSAPPAISLPRADARVRRECRRGSAASRWWYPAGVWLAAFALLASCTGGEPEAEPERPDDAVALPAPPPVEDVPEQPEPEPESPPAPPPAPPPPPASRDALITDASALVASAGLAAEGGDFSVLVLDEHGREVVAHRPDDPLLPASTLKIVTAAAVLSTFGSDARFGTRIEVTAPVDAAGVLDGELVLIGSGDPVLATAEYARWVYPDRPRTPLEELADAVVATGVREIRGDVVGVADGFDGPNVATGWPDRYFSSLDARYVDGLSVDAGLRTIVTYPELEDDDADPADGEAAAEDPEPEAEPTAAPASGLWAPPPDVEPIVRVDHAPDPAAHAAGELERLLVERGVEVLGDARAGMPSGTIVGRMARIESPPLDELLRFAVQRSDNQITDALFRSVGRARTGTGSFASGDRALRQVLDRYGIDHAGAIFADGSGLSRDDRATARLLVDVDRAMLGSRHASTWTSLMAVTGRSGTLETRLRGTVADGRFAGKTGTLQDVTGLVGTVSADGPRRYHLAVVANDTGGARWVSRALADELIVLLVADLDGCTVQDASGPDGTLDRPPLAVSC
jgi:serine-type D-Ala-D-Ala carboxypeptidase/endopeptidase (penicillin-binding protein 4)